MKTIQIILLSILITFFSCKKPEGFESKWTKLGNFPGKEINGCVAFSINKKIYIGWGACNYDFWQYLPNSDSWSKILDLSSFADRKNPHYFVIDDKGFILEGRPQCNLPKSKEISQLFMIFDAELLKWQAKTITNPEIYEYDTPLFTWNNKAVVIENSCYIKGLYNAFWEYNYPQDQWIKRDSFPGNRNCEISFGIGNKIFGQTLS
ncbi:MAG: hypothetical protein L3J74_16835 [Bacteroidales bacterium]|nr:hypothetical protein [Bacteroidales bacterium]